MYRPNFCSDCGAKIFRLNWYPWTSRRFCDSCSRRLRKERLRIPLAISAVVFVLGFLIGRSGRTTQLPLIIERNGNPQIHSRTSTAADEAAPTPSPNASGSSGSADSESGDAVYICGARTKKGTPCSRRMHEPVRCWQHKGMPAMLPDEKLVVR